MSAAPRPAYAEIAGVLGRHGLAARGGFTPEPGEAVPVAADGRATAAVVLVGNVGQALWPHFAPHAGDAPDALDRWTRTVMEPIATLFGARAVYPFDTPPLPFQRWAMRAEPVHPSPLGVLIHPDHGLWHAYRAALLFADPIDLPERIERASPCETCADKPCLAGCPVRAFSGEGYDVAACARHLDAPAGRDCLDRGCRARAACPVGTAYPPEQIRFHMAAFHAAL